MSYSVFISYSTLDLVIARSVREWLNSTGATVFLAEYSIQPSQPLSAAIISAINGCDLFVLLWSVNAKGSEWVPQEIGVAKGVRKPIMPVVLHAGVELPGFVRDLKYLELYKNPQAAAQWLRNFVMTEQHKKETDTLMLLGIASAVIVALLAGGK